MKLSTDEDAEERRGVLVIANAREIAAGNFLTRKKPPSGGSLFT
jgi:hypothetical protein